MAGAEREARAARRAAELVAGAVEGDAAQRAEDDARFAEYMGRLAAQMATHEALAVEMDATEDQERIVALAMRRIETWDAIEALGAGYADLSGTDAVGRAIRALDIGEDMEP